MGVELNPPFSFFFDDNVRKLFKDHPVAGTKQDVFEQIVRFTLSSEYAQTKELVGRLAQAAAERLGVKQATGRAIVTAD